MCWDMCEKRLVLQGIPSSEMIPVCFIPLIQTYFICKIKENFTVQEYFIL